MGAHVIDAFAPGVAVENIDRVLEVALERAGRSVLARHDATPPEKRYWQRHALRWEVVKKVACGETVLRTYEVNGPRWDPRFLRALSAATDGFVGGVELLNSQEHYALGAMFAGRTLETKVWDIVPGPPPTGIGYPSVYDSLRGWEGAYHTYLHWYYMLCSDIWFPASEKDILVAGEWETTPPLDGYPVDDESPTTRVLLAQVDEQRFLAKLPRIDAVGWRWRSFMTPAFAQPMIELAREGVLDTSQVASWGRIVECAYAGFEVPGGGEPPRTIEGHHDVVDRELVDAGIEPLLRALGHLGLDLGEMPEFPSGDPGSLNEAPGMMFGRGDTGWHQI